MTERIVPNQIELDYGFPCRPLVPKMRWRKCQLKVCPYSMNMRIPKEVGMGRTLECGALSRFCLSYMWAESKSHRLAQPHVRSPRSRILIAFLRLSKAFLDSCMSSSIACETAWACCCCWRRRARSSGDSSGGGCRAFERGSSGSGPREKKAFVAIVEMEVEARRVGGEGYVKHSGGR